MDEVTRYRFEELCPTGETMVMGSDYDAALSQLAALREELVEMKRYRNLYKQSEKTLDRVHCMYAKRLLEATGERQTVLIPDEEFVKYFEEIKGLKQRLADAERLLKRAVVSIDLLSSTPEKYNAARWEDLHAIVVDINASLNKPEEAKS